MLSEKTVNLRSTRSNIIDRAAAFMGGISKHQVYYMTQPDFHGPADPAGRPGQLA